MKRNMKRVWLVLCMVVCLFSLAACGRAADTSDLMSTEQISSLEQLASGTLEQFSGLTVNQMAESKAQAERVKDEILFSGLESWEGIKDDLGALVSVDSVEVSKESNGYLMNVKATFELRKLEFTMGVNSDVTAYTVMTFNPVYTLGEKMEQAGLNTLMGMGTVFLVLIFISLIIGCFKFINEYENRRNSEWDDEDDEDYESDHDDQLLDDLELVAVITAAIAASTGSSTDDLVVRSIKRAPAAKWKRV